MKKCLLLALAIFFFCQNSFAQFTSKDGEYEIYMSSDRGINEALVLVVHFMEDEAVLFTPNDQYYWVQYYRIKDILAKEPDALDKWVRGNSNYYYQTFKYNNSISSPSTNGYYGTYVEHLALGDMYHESALIFSKDHNSCVEYIVKNGKVTTSVIKSYVRKNNSDFVSSAKNKLQQQNKQNDGVIYD